MKINIFLFILVHILFPNRLSPHIGFGEEQNIEQSSLYKIGFINSNYLNIFNGIVSIHIGYKI